MDMINALYKNKLGDEVWARELVEEIWARGYVILPQFLDPQSFTSLQAVGVAMANKKSEELKGTVAYDLAHGEEMMTFFNTVHKVRCAKEGKEYAPLSPDKQVFGFPYKDARDGKRTVETPYHYDGAYVNITLAIKMPPTGGELIAFPNLRTGKNPLVIKIFSRALKHLPFLRNRVAHVLARSTPNDLCVFFGDRTFHGVEPISSGERLILTINAHW